MAMALRSGCVGLQAAELPSQWDLYFQSSKRMSKSSECQAWKSHEKFPWISRSLTSAPSTQAWSTCGFSNWKVLGLREYASTCCYPGYERGSRKTRLTSHVASVQRDITAVSASAVLAGELTSEAAEGSFVDGNLSYRVAVENETHGDGIESSDLIFIGTGTSEGIPRVSCLTDPSRQCPVCWAATQPGNPNRRRNTSLAVRYAHPDGCRRTILIDAGKFFYHSAMQWFPHYGIRRLDAVIITHSHADAIGGLDDLRDWTNNVQDDGIPIYVAQRDLNVMSKTHYYLVDSSGITPGTAVSTLHFHLIDPSTPFTVHGLQVVPLPVWHGKGYLSLGFRIGNVCYISDVSEIPEATYPLLQDCDLLILDALRPDKSSSTHFGLPAALDEIRKIRPKRTLLTGMMHTMDHDVINAQLAPLLEDEGLDVSLSYDGMHIPICL